MLSSKAHFPLPMEPALAGLGERETWQPRREAEGVSVDLGRMLCTDDSCQGKYCGNPDYLLKE